MARHGVPAAAAALSLGQRAAAPGADPRACLPLPDPSLRCSVGGGRNQSVPAPLGQPSPAFLLGGSTITMQEPRLLTSETKQSSITVVVGLSSLVDATPQAPPPSPPPPSPAQAPALQPTLSPPPPPAPSPLPVPLPPTGQPPLPPPPALEQPVPVTKPETDPIAAALQSSPPPPALQQPVPVTKPEDDPAAQQLPVPVAKPEIDPVAAALLQPPVGVPKDAAGAATTGELPAPRADGRTVAGRKLKQAGAGSDASSLISSPLDASALAEAVLANVTSTPVDRDGTAPPVVVQPSASPSPPPPAAVPSPSPPAVVPLAPAPAVVPPPVVVPPPNRTVVETATSALSNEIVASSSGYQYTDNGTALLVVRTACTALALPFTALAATALLAAGVRSFAGPHPSPADPPPPPPAPNLLHPQATPGCCNFLGFKATILRVTNTTTRVQQTLVNGVQEVRWGSGGARTA